MSISVHWVKSAQTAGGLDHIGSQAPCINIYGQLLPGLTNVTDRIRYYSFYPWFLKSLHDRYGTLEKTRFVELLRRAECLFALIAIQHAEHEPDNAQRHRLGAVGQDTLSNALHLVESGGSIQLSTHTTLEKCEARYFANKYGGLGQYYLSTLRQLGILAGDRRTGLKYVRGLGDELADSFSNSLDPDRFFEVLEQNSVALNDLDDLSSVCPCGIESNSAEREVLLDLMLDPAGRFGARGKIRRGTFGIMICLANELAQGSDSEFLDEYHFRSCVYALSDADNEPLSVPAGCIEVLKGWQTYQKNELLSFAAQAVFWLALERLRLEGGRIESLSKLRLWFRAEVVESSLGGDSKTRFGDNENDLPALGAWQYPNHEIQLAYQLRDLISSKQTPADSETCLRLVVGILQNLAARWATEDPYQGLAFPSGYFDSYPVNLANFCELVRGHWADFNVADVLVFLAMEWGVKNHLVVALRKLRYQTTDTFRIKPTDEGYAISDEPPLPVFTNPRFRQGRQALVDLGLLFGEQSGLTALGMKALEEFDQGA